MRAISCFQATEVQFTRDGVLFADAEAKEAEQQVTGLTDLIVMSHGWNNDVEEAQQLYDRFFGELCTQWQSQPPPGRAIGLLTILWPSKKFADRDLIPGGGAGVSDLADQAATAALDDLKGFLGHAPDLEKAKSLFEALDDDDEQTQRAFVEILRRAVASAKRDREDGLHELFGRDPVDILQKLGRPILAPVQPAEADGLVTAAHAKDVELDVSTTQGAGLGDKLPGVKGAGLRLLNLTTYYGMKERAGAVGTLGLGPLLERLLKVRPDLRLHLIGHSFGGRVVTAAASTATLVQNLRSLSLLQAAFSHYGFASEYEPGVDGAFRNVVADHRVNGPVLISQSIHDVPVGVAYAIASKLSGSVGAGLAGESAVQAASIRDRLASVAAGAARLLVGGPNDRYGGIGRNGALSLQATEGAMVNPVHPVGTAYDFSGARVFNLVCDRCIRGHSDICGPEIVYAVRQAIESGR